MTDTTLDAGEISISLNGEQRRVASGISVAALLGQLQLDFRKVAVERNETIVSRSRYAVTMLAQDDRIEIVHFIGGG